MIIDDSLFRLISDSLVLTCRSDTSFSYNLILHIIWFWHIPNHIYLSFRSSIMTSLLSTNMIILFIFVERIRSQREIGGQQYLRRSLKRTRYFDKEESHLHCRENVFYTPAHIYIYIYIYIYMYSCRSIWLPTLLNVHYKVISLLRKIPRSTISS